MRPEGIFRASLIDERAATIEVWQLPDIVFSRRLWCYHRDQFVPAATDGENMKKTGKTAILQPVQHTARMMRTILATRLLEHGLYAGQDAVLLQLAEEDGLPPGVLAQRLGVRPPTITKTVSRLQAQGFVSRQASDSDQRQSHIFLTDRGHDVILIIEKLVRRTEKDCLRGFEKKERRLLVKLLTRIERNLDAEMSGRISRIVSEKGDNADIAEENEAGGT
ncbi:MarR family winged helix-turn-helix transcriptional regulator [Pseudochrobactrum sp. HB0163]|uniref:MarR family winged helix-turn-helix transcriptional regulator n=1 Tax=Pseudochrobactrum sp. HB0163 TaxID=3450708 RepID=UPI003F6E0EB0